jgi:steroid delta-isomerase-like uncharacterized protein
MARTKASDAAETRDAPDAPASKPRRMTRRKAVEEHARSYFDALARRDLAGMIERWREDGVVDLAPIGMFRGRDEIAGLFGELFAALPDFEIRITRLVAGERQAAVEWRAGGHFTGSPFQGVEATGRPVELRGLDLMEIQDGKNVSITAYYDGMEFARQIGLMPPQDSGAERALKSAFNAATRLRSAVSARMGPR